MSLLAVYLVPEGLIFTADRNISREDDGTPRLVTVGQQPKVLRWPQRAIVLGYVGHASFEGRSADEWFHSFMDRHTDLPLGRIGPVLADELEPAMVDVDPNERGTIVHVGGFEEYEGEPLPVVWYVRDGEFQLGGAFQRLGAFEARDELKTTGNGQPPYFGSMKGSEIRSALRSHVAGFGWAGFRQCYDLAAYSALDHALWWFRGKLGAGIAQHKEHGPPKSLAEWEDYCKLSVLGFAAYFQAFYPEDEQVVGGGVDIESIAWPEG